MKINIAWLLAFAAFFGFIFFVNKVKGNLSVKKDLFSTVEYLGPVETEDSINKAMYDFKEDTGRNFNSLWTFLRGQEGEKGKSKRAGESEKKSGEIYPSDHIVFPDGAVHIPKNSLVPIKKARTQDGSRYYYDENGDLIKIGPNGKKTHYGRKQLFTDGKNVYINNEKAGVLKDYSAENAVTEGGNSYRETNGIITKTSKNGMETLIGKDGVLTISHSQEKLEVQAKSLNIPITGHITDDIVTENGSTFTVNEKGEIVETAKNGKTVNHGQGTLTIDKDGNLKIRKADGTEKSLGKIDHSKGRGVKTKKGSLFYKNKSGEVIEVKKNGDIVNHGKGEIEVKDGKVFVKKADGTEEQVGDFQSRFAVLSTPDEDILIAGDDYGIVKDGRYQRIEDAELEITQQNLDYPHAIQSGEQISTSDGYTYTIDSEGNLIETNPQGKQQTLGKADVYYNGRDMTASFKDGRPPIKKPVLSITGKKADIVTKDVHKLFNLARRLKPGQTVYTVYGNTYRVLADGLISRHDASNNLTTFPGVLYVEKGWLYILTPDGVSAEEIAKQKLQDRSILETDRGSKFVSLGGKDYEEKNNRLIPRLSLDILDNAVKIDGRYAGNIKDTAETKKIGEDKKYTPKTDIIPITASLTGDNRFTIAVGNDNISGTVKNPLLSIPQDNPSSKTEKVEKRLEIMRSRLNSANEKQPADQNYISLKESEPVTNGIISFPEGMAEDEGVEGEDYFVIPPLTLIPAKVMFGALAPVERSQAKDADITFKLVQNLNLRNGMVIPLSQEGKVDGIIYGEYNTGRGVPTTGIITFFDPVSNDYFVADLKGRVISVRDYITGLPGKTISKRDEVMLTLMQAGMIKGFSDFMKAVVNPWSTLQGQQQVGATNMIGGGLITGLGDGFGEHIKFLTENAKDLKPMIVTPPGEWVLIETKATTRVEKI